MRLIYFTEDFLYFSNFFRKGNRIFCISIKNIIKNTNVIMSSEIPFKKVDLKVQGKLQTTIKLFYASKKRCKLLVYSKKTE